MVARKKPTKAEQKAKSQKRQQSQLQQQAFIDLLKEAGARKVVLHLGCGKADPEKLHSSFRGEGWFEIRVDADSQMEPDLVATMTDLSLIPTGSVNAVYSSHQLHKLYAHEAIKAVKEMHRVLKASGGVLLSMPDLQVAANYVAHGRLTDPVYDSAAGPIAAL